MLRKYRMLIRMVLIIALLVTVCASIYEYYSRTNIIENQEDKLILMFNYPMWASFVYPVWIAQLSLLLDTYYFRLHTKGKETKTFAHRVSSVLAGSILVMAIIFHALLGDASKPYSASTLIIEIYVVSAMIISFLLLFIWVTRGLRRFIRAVKQS